LKKSELIPDTVDQLIEGGKVFTAGDGTVVIIGDTDTVAFQDVDGWQVAERVYWKNVEDVDFTDEMLRKYARRWIHEYGSRTRPGMAVEVKDNFGVSYDQAVIIVQYIANAVITID
jgi:hypothetical protein